MSTKHRASENETSKHSHQGGKIKDARQVAGERVEELIKQADQKDSESEKRSEKSDVTVTSAEFKQLKAQLEELSQLRERWLRQAADFENSKKRIQREKEDFIKYAHEELMRALLPALQNLDRVVHHGQKRDNNSQDPLVCGVELVIKQIHQVLEAYGVKRVESVGKTFDPHIHEAVAHVFSDYPESTIVEESEPGYLLFDRLIKPAKVLVSKGPESGGKGIVTKSEDSPPQPSPSEI